MALSKNNFLDHVRLLREAVLDQGGEFLIAGDSLQVLLRQGTAHWTLYPQFMATIDGVRQYTTQLVPEAQNFAGWLPYRNRRWRLASDKLAFKNFVASVGLKTPEFSFNADAELNDVVVKRAESSFGEQVHGPYRSSKERPIDLAQGEFYERFIEGRILKIWYWNDQPICTELDPMPAIKGDGISTIGDMIVRRAALSRRQSDQDKERLLMRCAALLKFYGVTASTLLPANQRQIIEFRYGTDLMHSRDRRLLDLRTANDRPWFPELYTIGEKLYGTIPNNVRNGTIFTVDAILDAQQDVWLLEMNSNPQVHPLVYPRMIADLIPATPDNATPIAVSQLPGQSPNPLQSA